MRGLFAFAVLLAATAWAIDEDCASCHAKQSRAWSATPMARALQPAAQSPILKANPKLEFVSGPYKYALVRDGDGSVYTVSDGRDTFQAPILWSFGPGAAGQTYVFERDGIMYESRLSFYIATGGLDLTMGAPGGIPKSLDDAAGRKMTLKDMQDCFGCHSQPGSIKTRATLDSAAFHPGVRCAGCHRDSDRHSEALIRKSAKPFLPAKLAKLTSEESSELCGKCHRTWSDIQLSGPRGRANVRFQPYRLANSPCYDTEDRRIGCVACHDPHEGLNRAAAVTSYDLACLACHVKTAQPVAGKRVRVCTQAAAGCVACHMPKYEIPGSHHRFTDHHIRIVRSNETYPN